MRASASSFKLQYHLVSSRSCGSCLRLLPHLPITCIFVSFFFPSMTLQPLLGPDIAEKGLNSFLYPALSCQSSWGLRICITSFWKMSSHIILGFLELRCRWYIITSSYRWEGKYARALESSVGMVFGEMNIKIKYFTGHRRMRTSS